MKIIDSPISWCDIARMAEAGFGELVKAVVDVELQGAVGMNMQHSELAAGRWQTFSLAEQLANVGSEVERALTWAAKGNADYTDRAFERALELLGLTIEDPRHRHRLRELTRVREALLDYFWGENEFGSSEPNWRRYFHAYGMATAIGRERAA